LQASEPTSHLARFLREAQALAMLQHRNIVRVYDIDVHDDMHYIAMEFIGGHDLQRVVAERGPLDARLAADYIAQAAAGLAHAHQRQLVHRDIKPANLMLDEQGVIKLLDLGVARVGDDETSLTVLHDDRMLGTADFIAPEQALNSHTVGPAADVYSLGCTLYFLLTGRAPFHTGTAAERLLAHQMKAPPDVRGERNRLGLETIDEGLADLCSQMMAKSPDDRPSAAMLHETLQPIAAGEHTAAAPAEKPSAAPTARTPTKGATRANFNATTKSTNDTMSSLRMLDTRAEPTSEVAPRLRSKPRSLSQRAAQKGRSGLIMIAGALGLLLLTLGAGGVALGLHALRAYDGAAEIDERIAGVDTATVNEAAEFPLLETENIASKTEPAIAPVVENVVEPQSERPPTLPVTSSEAVKYYVVGNGKKYHRADCRHRTATAREINAADAKANYQPCKVCQPKP
jgi:serine/threonine protein kinase